jgi:hypothetical protein
MATGAGEQSPSATAWLIDVTGLVLNDQYGAARLRGTCLRLGGADAAGGGCGIAGGALNGVKIPVDGVCLFRPTGQN